MKHWCLYTTIIAFKSVLPIIGSAMLTFSIFAVREQTTRVFLLINAIIWSVYTGIVGSTGFFAEVITAMTTVYALWKYRKNPESP